MIGARRAQAKVDEANELTRLVRPASGAASGASGAERGGTACDHER